MVTDSEQEKNFGFSLRDSLSRARERRLLEVRHCLLPSSAQLLGALPTVSTVLSSQGYEIHVTPRVRPPPPQMAEIISCCGGTVLSSMPRSYKVPVGGEGPTSGGAHVGTVLRGFGENGTEGMGMRGALLIPIRLSFILYFKEFQIYTKGERIMQ